LLVIHYERRDWRNLEKLFTGKEENAFSHPLQLGKDENAFTHPLLPGKDENAFTNQTSKLTFFPSIAMELT
jgi:hypothetical protein